MVKISELSFETRLMLITDISKVMSGYGIDQESTEEFWETVGIGIEMKKRA